MTFLLKYEHISDDPVLNARHPRIEADFKKFDYLNYRHIHTLNHNQESLFPAHSSPHLVNKVPNWEEWACTDCCRQIHPGTQVTGAGTYHPATSTASFVKLNGMGITNTIGKTELAAITAAILHGHSHIATDSLSSLQQIRKHLLYPELHQQHEQGDILKMLVQLFATHQTLCTF